VHWLTLKGSDAQKSAAFFQQLKQDGFTVEQRFAGDNPSFLVDLTPN